MLVNAHFSVQLPWVTGHLQTARDRIMRPPYDLGPVSEEHDLLVPLLDGSNDALVVRINRPTQAPRSRSGLPMVVLVHGMGGTLDSYYVRASALGLLRAGFPVARVDLRGAGASAQHSRELYHGGRTEDLRDVLRALPGRNGLAIMGFSLGGNLVLKLLGEPHAGIELLAGVSVSAPLDLAAGTTHLQEMSFGLYDRYLLRKLRQQASHPNLEMTEEDRAALRDARSLTDFDNSYTARRNGWRDAAEYYALNSSAQYLPGIRVPTLVIHSVDDPMIPVSCYQAVDWDALARDTPVRRLITRRGGHVGFHEQSADVPWYVRAAVAHLRRQLIGPGGRLPGQA